VADPGNPYGKPQRDRLQWAQGLNVPLAQPGEEIDLLYWIGCAGSFSPEGQSISRAMVKILEHLGVNFRVLGVRERCTGDPARRMGEEGLFRECAAENLRTLFSHKVRRVLTHCPHCFNSFRNEYAPLAWQDVTWTTQHHSEFLADQIGAGKLRVSARLRDSVTFHDPCYLGRGNGVVSEPPPVLAGLDLPHVEMPRHGVESFCCGAGGGAMWLDVRGHVRIEDQRYAEAAETGASVVGTGCPSCKTMLSAARQSAAGERPNAPRILDLAELVVQAEGL
jgi:Fe-S oxidoreductase